MRKTGYFSLNPTNSEGNRDPQEDIQAEVDGAAQRTDQS